MKNIKLLLIMKALLLFGFNQADPSLAEVENLSNLCNKFPLNSRCKNYRSSSTKPETQVYQLNRDRFCQEFSFNSHCQQEPIKTIKLNLKRSGEDDEWIRLEKQGNKVGLLHTTKVKDFLPSLILDAAFGLVPYPLPFDSSKYKWEDHQVIKLSFKSDRCKTDDCIVTGNKVLNLPAETNIYQGLFTIEYKEKKLIRSLSFRIPPDAKVATVDTVIVEIPGKTSSNLK